MIEQFTKDVYKDLVLGGVEIYQYMYENMTNQIYDDSYWDNLKGFYSNLTIQQKDVLFSVIKQIMIDTISGVFGVLDGSSNLDGKIYECDVIVNGIDMDHDLQDYFLSYIQSDKAVMND